MNSTNIYRRLIVQRTLRLGRYSGVGVHPTSAPLDRTLRPCEPHTHWPLVLMLQRKATA